MQNCLKINERTLSKIIKESISKLLNGTSNSSFDLESIFNLSKIPYEELKSQYADYSFFSQSSGFRIVKENIDIEEQAKNAKKEIQKIFNLKDWQVVIRQGENNVEVIVLFANIFKNSKLIKQEMKRLGFFPSLSKKIFKGFMLWNATKFEPYNQKDLKDEVRRIGVLYHLTPEYNVKGISKNGLVPSSSNSLFKYPNRIYLLKGTIDNANIQSIGRQLYDNDKRKNKKNNGRYVLYRVNLRYVPDDVQFFGDPNYAYGYFTQQPIPKDALTLMRTYQF